MSRSSLSSSSSSYSSSTGTSDKHSGLSDCSSSSDDSDVTKTIATDLVVTKYKMAGDSANRVLQQVLARCIVGASLQETCKHGDYLIVNETSQVYKRVKDMKKGVAFPTCISVNNCIGNFSPIIDENDYILKDEDVVKVDIGVHVDGYVALVSHTIVVGATGKVKGRKADVIMAAHFASEVALRLIRPGCNTNAAKKTIKSMCQAFKCSPVQGIVSHRLKQFEFGEKKAIILNPLDSQKELAVVRVIKMNEVYSVDIVVSTGDGVGREDQKKESIFIKTDATYQLKLKASRMVFTEIVKKYNTLPFTLRSFEDSKRARLGLAECIKHNLVSPLRVSYEKPGEYVAHFKFTVLLMRNGPHKITGIPFEHERYESEYSYHNCPSLEDVMNKTSNPMRAKKKRIKKDRKLREAMQALTFNQMQASVANSIQ